jgi:hypothetical protein
MMDVRLPDGTIINNVPEGTTKDQLVQKLSAKGYDTSWHKPAAPAAPTPAPKEADSFMSRLGTGLADPIYGAAQLADKAINPLRQMISPGASSMDDVVKSREAEYNAPEGADIARIVGNVANPVTWVGSGKGKVLAKTAEALLAHPVKAAAMTGAAQSALEPVTDENFWTEKAKQAGFGAGAGAVTSKLLRGVGTPTAEAQKLMDQGIQPSVGQALGGVANRLESRITSVPLIGDAALMARTRPLKEFDQKVISRATQGGAETLEDANKFASNLFDEVVPHLKPTKESVLGVQQSLQAARQNPEMTADNLKMLEGLVGKHFQQFGTLSGEGIKKLDSELGYLGRKYAAGDPASKTLSSEIYNVLGALRGGLETGLPPDMQGKLSTANTVWKDLIPLNKAASARADEKITPRALQKAIARQKRTDVTRMAPDDLIDPAVAVLPQSVPDSGTAGRLLLGGGIATGLGITAPTVGLGALAGIGATRPVQAALLGNTKLQRALSPQELLYARNASAALRGVNREEQ